MAQQRAHVVHLPMASSGVAAGTIDFLHDDRGFGQAQSRAAVLLGDQGGQPASLGQSLHKLGGITLLGIRSEEHTSELQSRGHLVCRLLLEKKKIKIFTCTTPTTHVTANVD